MRPRLSRRRPRVTFRYSVLRSCCCSGSRFSSLMQPCPVWEPRSGRRAGSGSSCAAATAAAQDQQRDQHREQRVDRRPAGRQDHDGSDARRDRAEQVADHVQARRRHVQVAAVAALEHAQHGQVGQQAEHRDAEHGAACDFARRLEALDGFPEDPGDHGEQRQRIDEGGEDLHPVMTAGARSADGALADARSEPGQREGGGIRQHVPGVGEQRERAREQSADDLEHHERRRDGERPAETASVRAVGVQRGRVVGQGLASGGIVAGPGSLNSARARARSILAFSQPSPHLDIFPRQRADPGPRRVGRDSRLQRTGQRPAAGPGNSSRRSRAAIAMKRSSSTTAARTARRRPCGMRARMGCRRSA